MQVAFVGRDQPSVVFPDTCNSDPRPCHTRWEADAAAHVAGRPWSVSGLPGTEVDALGLVVGRDLALHELGDLAANVGQLLADLGAEVLLDLDDRSSVSVILLFVWAMTSGALLRARRSGANTTSPTRSRSASSFARARGREGHG
jgi:hypothetical protein